MVALLKHREDQRQKIKALLIDDNYEFFQVLIAGMKNKMDIEYAPDGFTAIHMFKKQNFDIAICDIHMPMLNGIDLLTEFKKKNINIPFVFVTGNMDEKIIKQAFQAGAYNLLEKPFEMDLLLEKSELALKLYREEYVEETAEQEKAYIYNTLKSYYYDIDRIVRVIQQYNISMSTIQNELDKKKQTGKCIFDDLSNLKFLNKFL